MLSPKGRVVTTFTRHACRGYHRMRRLGELTPSTKPVEVGDNSLWDYPNSIRDNEQRKNTDPNKQSSKIAFLRVSAMVLSLDNLIDN